MPSSLPGPKSLVLYKTHPARVLKSGDRLEIELEDGKRVRVRPKDVVLLHSGPVGNLRDLTPPPGDVETAWELLIGEEVSLAELAELVYGAYTPATAWGAWQYVADGLYFHGSPERITARPPEAVAAERDARRAKTAEKEAWAAFLRRLRASDPLIEADRRYLSDVEALALEKQSHSRVLRELGRAQTPENAHALLLKVGHWSPARNPYPDRFRLPTRPPDLPLPPLSDESRADLTHLPAFAIDDEGSRDPDDAISLEGSRLWVHIADVAALVPPDSPADAEARARGANLYLPEGTVPMLPPAATPILGLGLRDVSPALSFGLDVTPDGEVARVEIVPSWVRVQRLTYEEAETRLHEAPFDRLLRLARTAQARRQANGAIEIELPEVKVRVVDGVVQIRPIPALDSRLMVQEAMLLCGEALAQFAVTEDIPFPFSTQEPPDERPEVETGMAGMFALRRKMKRSQLKSVPAPHAGLGLRYYAQATSPLRRYLDLVAHQQLRAYLRGDPPLTAQDILTRVGEAEAVSGSVRQVERLSNRHWTLVYLLQNPGWRGEGVVVERSGRRARLLIPTLDLETHLTLREAPPLNSIVPLQLNHVNLPTLEAHFLLFR